jgi:hypothetical protein
MNSWGLLSSLLNIWPMLSRPKPYAYVWVRVALICTFAAIIWTIFSGYGARASWIPANRSSISSSSSAAAVTASLTTLCQQANEAQHSHHERAFFIGGCIRILTYLLVGMVVVSVLYTLVRMIHLKWYSSRYPSTSLSCLHNNRYYVRLWRYILIGMMSLLICLQWSATPIDERLTEPDAMLLHAEYFPLVRHVFMPIVTDMPPLMARHFFAACYDLPTKDEIIKCYYR